MTSARPVLPVDCALDAGDNQRGMGTEEAAQVASMVARVLGNIEDKELQRQVADEVRELTSGFPVPGIDD